MNITISTIRPFQRPCDRTFVPLQRFMTLTAPDASTAHKRLRPRSPRSVEVFVKLGKLKGPTFIESFSLKRNGDPTHLSLSGRKIGEPSPFCPLGGNSYEIWNMVHVE